MKSLTTLLERYTHIQAPDATLKKAFVKAVEDIVEINIEVKDITISKTTIFLNAPSAVKSEIRINQREILTKVAQDVGNSKVLTAII